MGNMGLPLHAIRTQIVSAVDMIVQVERQRDGKRRITQVTEVCGSEGEMILLNDIFQFTVEGEGTDGTLVGRYKCQRSRPGFQSRLNYFRLDRAWTQAIEEASL
jgi:pilus assembly protein CpaF